MCSIRQRQLRCRAEVDVVVARRDRRDLSSGGGLLAILFEAGLDERLVEAERGLKVTGVVAIAVVAAGRGGRSGAARRRLGRRTLLSCRGR